MTLEAAGYREEASALRRQVDTLTASGQETAQALSVATAEVARTAQQLAEARRAQRETGADAQARLALAQVLSLHATMTLLSVVTNYLFSITYSQF